MIYKCDIADTVVVGMRWNTSNRHTDSEPDVTVSNNSVLGALGILCILIRRLDRNCVIIVRNVETLDDKVFASWIYAIRVKCISWYLWQEAILISLAATSSAHKEPLEL